MSAVLRASSKATELQGRFFAVFSGLGIGPGKLMLKALWTTFPRSDICWQICQGPFSITAPARGFREPAGIRSAVAVRLPVA